MSDEGARLNSYGCSCLNEKKYREAYESFVKSAKLGNYYGLYNVGYCLYHGFGVAKNYDKARGIFTKFIGIDCSVTLDALYLAGVISDFGGYGVVPDGKVAELWYSICAEREYAWAQLMLGQLKIRGKQYYEAEDYIMTAMKNAPNDYELQQRGKKLLKTIKFNRWFG